MNDKHREALIEQWRDADYNQGVDAGRQLERSRMLARIADLRNQKFFENKQDDYKAIAWVERVLESE